MIEVVVLNLSLVAHPILTCRGSLISTRLN